MLIYKQRYKPRTTRAFTKSDLTVYDSAGNTALNALTVYGKSEVVDGSIKSAGEGFAVVDLGTFTWDFGNSLWYSLDLQNTIKSPPSNNDIANVKCNIYRTTSRADILNRDKQICITSTGVIGITNSDYTDRLDFKNAMLGVLLCYPLADPTQGNAIAVKTDNGSGIDGTMATFSTGTPLRGIPNTDVRDVMQWDANVGTVTKICNAVKLADFTWQWTVPGPNSRFYATLPKLGWADSAETRIAWICNDYTPAFYSDVFYHKSDKIIALNWTGASVQLYDSSYNNLTDFVASLGDAELIYELATPTTEQLTTAENASLAGLRTFAPQTHAENNAQTEMTIDYTIRVPTN